MSEAGARIVRGLLEALLLRSLAEGPKHGYAVLRELAELGGEAPNRNKLYPLLARLEAQGLVVRTGEDGSGPGRARTLYELTDAGRAELDLYRRLPGPLRDALANLVALDARPNDARNDAPAPPPPAATATEAPPPIAPASNLPYPCPDARVALARNVRTGDLEMRLTGCPMGAYEYCPLCPVFSGIEGVRRLATGR